MKNHRLITIVSGIALLALAHGAAARPTWTTTSLQIPPTQVAKFVAAFDKLMSSKAGKQFAGRITLRAHLADGPDPASHSVVALSESAAQAEANTAALSADPEFGTFLSAVATAVAQPGQTLRGIVLQSWGDLSDADTVWINHFLTVDDLPAVMNAMNAYRETATGKNAPGQTHLSQIQAGGLDSPSHVISIAYASQAEMEQYLDGNVGNPDLQALLAALNAASDYRGATLQVEMKAWGNASIEDVTAP
jgi:hypothetical protein